MASAYSPEQIAQYESYINLPHQFRLASKPALTIQFLRTLHQYQLAPIPYENLAIHYSPSHEVIIDPQHLFTKIVTNARGRGGYCMENSIFFNHVLRAYGFRVYTAGAKIRLRVDGVPCGNYIGWVHIVNVVTLPDGERYMLDVSFGGDGATLPIALRHQVPQRNLGSQEIRLSHEALAEQADPHSSKYWVYEYRNGPDRPWNAFYAFPELEFLECDFGILNYWTSKCEGSFQTNTILVVRFLLDEAGDDGAESRVCGKRMLVDGVVKENLGGKTTVLKVCESEEERTQALEHYFGINLKDEEKSAIRGWRTELK